MQLDLQRVVQLVVLMGPSLPFRVFSSSSGFPSGIIRQNWNDTEYRLFLSFRGSSVDRTTSEFDGGAIR